MMRPAIAFVVAGLMLILRVSNIMAQETGNECKDVLEKTQKIYESGNFAQAIDYLTPCMHTLNKDEMFEAYRMLGICYMHLNNKEKAHESNINLLKTKPTYRDFPYFDPLEYTVMLQKYDIWSSLRLGFKASVNVNSVRPIKNYSLTGSEATFEPRTGYQAGGLAEYYFRKNTSVKLEILMEGLGYKRTADNVSGWKQEFEEKLTYLTLPVSFSQKVYEFNKTGIGLELGLQNQILLKTNSNIILKNTETSESFQNTLNQKEQRNKILYSLFPGLVTTRKLGDGWLIANFRYGFGLSNVVDPKKRYQNMDFSITNQYIDSDIAFNTFSVSVSYQIPVHNMYSVRLKKE